MKKIDINELLGQESETKEKRVGFVTIIGRPNAGKSTFLNNLIGEKISITSNVPQTTRNKITAIYNSDDLQIVFLDTPGIHKSEKVFNEEIISRAKSAISEADLILYFIDGSRSSWEEEAFLREIVETSTRPYLEVYTKSDLGQKQQIVEWALSVSSETKEGFPELIDEISKHMSIWPLLYPEDYYTKQAMFFRVSEIIREKAFFYTKQELPHSIFVQVEEVKEEKKMYRISSYIYVETDSQKYIVIGNAWKLITRISTEARKDLEEILWKKVFLTVRVKVRKNWRKDEGFIKKLLK